MRFETLIERYHDELYGYVWRLLDSASWTSGATDPAADAQDLVQDVFLRAYGSFERLRPESNHRAWLYRIATNCAYSALKRTRRRAALNLPLPDDEGQGHLADDEPGPFGLLVRQETRSALETALAALPVKQQSAVIMRHIQGLEYAEIAEAMNCSEDSARANVYQAIKRLRGVFGGQDAFDPEVQDYGGNDGRENP